MKLVVFSRDDIASMNILNKIEKIAEDVGEFEGEKVLMWKNSFFVIINKHHLYCDNIDEKFSENFQHVDGVIFASRHKSISKMKTLTVHPVGNLRKAEYGGKDFRVVMTSPHLMSHALRLLKKNSGELHYKVSFEATHHGPYLESPSFYIEIGSTEEEWKDEDAGEVIATTILDVLKTDVLEYPVAIGVGGGHYMPRVSDICISKKINFGHMVPTYVVESHFSTEMLKEIISKTPDIRYVYFHKKKLKKDDYRKLKKMFDSEGVEEISSKDLEDI